MNRLKEAREAIGITQSKLADVLGVTSSFISQVERGDKDLSREILLRLNETYGISIDWFLTGKGQMSHSATFEKDESQIRHSVVFEPNTKTHNNPFFTEDLDPDYGLSGSQGKDDHPPGFLAKVKRQGSQIQDVGETAKRNYGYPKDVTVFRYRKGSLEPVEIKEPDVSGMVFIPVYSQCAAAGPGQPPTQLEETDGSMPVIYDLFGSHNPKNCGICRVVGDSMTDITLSNGDWVIFDRSDTSGDGIFVMSMYGEVRVKRLHYRLSDRKVVISSENAKRYPEPELVSVDNLEKGNLIIYGRVFSWMHKHPY